jgi:hypothetical protein
MRVLAAVDRWGKNRAMVTIVAFATIAVAAAIGIAWATRFGRSVDGQIDGLSALLGGWRQAGWPSGIQEDDAEACWADRHGRPALRKALFDPVPPIETFVAGDAEPPFSSWIEELD